MTKPHAGNTGRHEDSILWDRLRADLAKLGAAYGELPAHIRDYQEGPCETVPDHSGDVTNMIEPDYDAVLLAARKKREVENRQPDPKCGHCKAVFRSEDACIAHGLVCGQRDVWNWLNGRRLTNALSKPLSFDHRVGWKPGDCE
jgi:hypothetical protein